MPESAISNKAPVHTQHLQQLFNYLMREKKPSLPYRYNCCLKNRKPQHEKKPEPNLIKSSSSLEISGIPCQPAKPRCLCARNRNEIYLKVPFPESPTTTTPPMIGRPPTRQFPKLFGRLKRRSGTSPEAYTEEKVKAIIEL